MFDTPRVTPTSCVRHSLTYPIFELSMSGQHRSRVTSLWTPIRQPASYSVHKYSIMWSMVTSRPEIASVKFGRAETLSCAQIPRLGGGWRRDAECPVRLRFGLDGCRNTW